MKVITLLSKKAKPTAFGAHDLCTDPETVALTVEKTSTCTQNYVYSSARLLEYSISRSSLFSCVDTFTATQPFISFNQH